MLFRRGQWIWELILLKRSRRGIESLRYEDAFSLMEMILTLFLFSLLLASLLPLLPILREREVDLAREIAMEEEAIRFYSYMENQHMNLTDWVIPSSSYSVTTYTYGSPTAKKYYHDGFRVVEVDVRRGGNLFIAHDVKSVLFIDDAPFLRIRLTLKRDDEMRTYEGVLPRYIEGGGNP